MTDRENVIKESEEAIDILAKAEEPTFWLDFVRCAFENAIAMLKEQENQLTMKYEEGFHDGYKQAMRESVPCYECQEFSCDDCKFKDNRTVKCGD